MLNTKFDAWCSEATGKICYWRDRDAVSAELRAHLEDKYDALLASGMSAEEATKKTLESMGSPAEIALQLGRIHRPWLGYLYSLMKFLGISTGLLATGVLLLVFYGSLGNYFVSRQPYLPRVYENISYYCEPELSAYVDVYYIRIEEAAVGEYEEETKFFFQMKIRWWPWMMETHAPNYLWAVDSLGNYYAPYSNRAYGQHHVNRHGYSGGGWEQNATMALEQFDTDAQWVEICYDRDGRKMVFHIDLTGGDARE